jgi:hypothetical protein
MLPNRRSASLSHLALSRSPPLLFLPLITLQRLATPYFMRWPTIQQAASGSSHVLLPSRCSPMRWFYRSYSHPPRSWASGAPVRTTLSIVTAAALKLREYPEREKGPVVGCGGRVNRSGGGWSHTSHHVSRYLFLFPFVFVYYWLCIVSWSLRTSYGLLLHVWGGMGGMRFID